ncbi:hypothetical protein P5673_005920 [Acropora cervicornis]|uniref:Uncharacterized protein n=1 Tax=Acropora cervicornis TaxID=6130 RepID=A0AAD9QX06_ACRCE|nr:hypothetical protein P5673_005920 [Acropora cervicornis]
MSSIPVLRHPDSFYQPPRAGTAVPTSDHLGYKTFFLLLLGRENKRETFRAKPILILNKYIESERLLVI